MEEVTLKLYFKDATGETVTWNFKRANKTAGASVRPLMEAMIANNAAFKTPPAVIDSAEFIVTTSTPVSL